MNITSTHFASNDSYSTVQYSTVQKVVGVFLILISFCYIAIANDDLKSKDDFISNAQERSSLISNSKTIDFVTPLTLDFVLGQDYFLDYSGAIKTTNNFSEINENIFWRTGGIEPNSIIKGKSVFGDKLHVEKITPLAHGNCLSRIYVGENNIPPSSAKYFSSSEPFRIYVNMPLTNPETLKNVLVIGDSYTGAFIWLPYMVGKYMKELNNYRFIGQFKKTELNNYPAVNCQAMGGYTWNNYVNAPKTLPAKYPLNPFWYNGAFDLRSYVAEYAGEDEELDYIILLIGINSFVNESYFRDRYNFNIDTAITDMNKLAIQFIDNVHTTFPNCKILLCGYPYTPRDNVNAYNWSTLTFNNAVAEMNKLYRSITVPRQEYVRFVQTSMLVNRFSAHKKESTNIDVYSDKILWSFDYVHLTEVGYKQLADAIYAGFCGLVNNSP
jgi:lysophospholipase L1-like esterase